MNEQYYQGLCDDVQQYIGMAEKKLDLAKDALLLSGSPGVRLQSRKAKEILFKLSECRTQLDELPTELGPTTYVANQAGQPISDFPSGIPTDEEFNTTHSKPNAYGDEADWLLVSQSVPAEKALEMIQKEMRDEYGMDEDCIPKSVDDLRTYDVGWGYDHDSYHYSEGSYWLCGDKDQVTKRWKAWGAATQ